MPWQSRNHTVLVKVINVTVIITFIFSSCQSYAFQARTLFGTKPHCQRYVKSKAETNLINIKDNPWVISLPSGYGQIVESYKGKGNALVVHIQDCHVNQTAQLNISGILKSLLQNYDMRLLCLEGATKELDTSFYDSFPDGQIKEKVSRFFVKTALFTGAEYFKITNRNLGISAFGVEDKNLYLDHLRAYQDNQPDKEKIVSYLNGLEAALDKIKTRLYSKPLKELESKNKEHQGKNIALAEYASYIAGSANTLKIDLGPYPNFKKFVKLTKREKEIDFEKAEQQRSKLIEELSQGLKGKELKRLLELSLGYRLNKISRNAFYDYLQDLLLVTNYQLPVTSYQELLSYIDYLKISGQINHLKLFDEIESLYEKIASALFKTPAQESLFRFSKSLAMLKDLYNLRLTHQALSYIEANPEEFDIGRIAFFIKTASNSLGIPAYLDDGPGDTNVQDLKAAQRFYKIATERDMAIVNNTLKRLPHSSNKTAVLITGGFHTSGITSILREKEISYVVICPNIGMGNYQKLYDDRIKGIVPDYADILQVVSEMLVPALTTGGITDNLKIKTAFSIAFAGILQSEGLKRFLGTNKQGLILPDIGDDSAIGLKEAAEIIRAAIAESGEAPVAGLPLVSIKMASAGQEAERRSLSGAESIGPPAATTRTSSAGSSVLGRAVKATKIALGTAVVGGGLIAGVAVRGKLLRAQPEQALVVAQAAPANIASPQPEQAAIAVQPVVPEVALPKPLQTPVRPPAPTMDIAKILTPHPAIVVAEEGLTSEQKRNYRAEWERIPRIVDLVFGNRISEEQKRRWRLLLLGTVSVESDFLDTGATFNGSGAYQITGETARALIHDYAKYPIEIKRKGRPTIRRTGIREEFVPLFARATNGRVTWERLMEMDRANLKRLLAEDDIAAATEGRVTWERLAEINHGQLKRLLAEDGEVAKATEGRATWKKFAGMHQAQQRKLCAEDNDYACLISILKYLEVFGVKGIETLPADPEDLAIRWKQDYNTELGKGKLDGPEGAKARFGRIHRPISEALKILHAKITEGGLYNGFSDIATLLLLEYDYGIRPANIYSKLTPYRILEGFEKVWYAKFKEDERLHIVLSQREDRIRTTLVVCKDISQWAAGEEGATGEEETAIQIELHGQLYRGLVDPLLRERDAKTENIKRMETDYKAISQSA